MIVGFSTSSPVASVALIDVGGEVLWSGSDEARHAASGACLKLLERGLRELGKDLAEASLFVADLGPGSFTGVRVGVTLAKTLAFAYGKETAGADAFDLIDFSGVVVLPSKRSEWFVRRPGQIPERVEVLPDSPFSGFGPGIESPRYPNAAGFAPLVGSLIRCAPEELVPGYLIEPSISTPKKPYGAGFAQ